MVGWNHQLNGHEFEQTLGDSEGQGSHQRCIPLGERVAESDMTEQQHETKESVLFTIQHDGSCGLVTYGLY